MHHLYVVVLNGVEVKSFGFLVYFRVGVSKGDIIVLW